MESEAGSGFLLAFLLPFHVGGGAAIGVALHRLFRGGIRLDGLGNNAFLLIWGLLFGGMPLVFGLNQGWFFGLQLAIFVGTIAVVAVGYEWLRELYRQPGMFIASFGLAFLLIGASIVITSLQEGDAAAPLFGLVFGGVGGLILLVGVVMMLRT